jgi:hypothetical protein
VNLKTQFNISKFVNQKIKQTKAYFKSDSFEDDLDYLIINLQMFDAELEVPQMNRVGSSQRISKKICLVKASFRRLNIEFAPLGMTVGSSIGPKGMAFGSLLGTYIFLGCMSVVFWKRFSEMQAELAPI